MLGDEDLFPGVAYKCGDNRKQKFTNHTEYTATDSTKDFCSYFCIFRRQRVRIHQSRILSIALFDQGEKNSTIKTNQSSIYQSGAVWEGVGCSEPRRMIGNVKICPMCTYHNKLSSVSCLVCDAPFVQPKEDLHSYQEMTDSSQGEGSESYIECPHCTFHNPKGLKVCDACSGTLKKRKRINATLSPENPEIYDCKSAL
jgi:hypothetical protein